MRPKQHRPRPSQHAWWRARLAAVLALWAVLMFPLLFWGLPSASADPLLFGGAASWTAEQYGLEAALARFRGSGGGADRDLNPLTARDRLVELTPDHAARAEILMRYRLYSRQPDEMIVLRSLARMQPRQGNFDPRLYQYGGGYIYLVGAALGGAGMTGLVPLTRDLGYYLEHPDAFGRLYVVARCVSLVFGGLTLIAAFRLARRAGGRLAGWLAFVLIAGSPVFLTAVLEAKPHLPSACLILWATLSGIEFQRRGQARDALRMGWQGGYAFGLVLTGCAALLLWPVLAVLGRSGAKQRWMAALGLGALLALAVYVGTNPYVPYNFLFNREALASNLGNSTAMYENQLSRWPVGMLRVGELLGRAAGIVPVVGAVAAAWLIKRWPRPLLLVAAPGTGILLMCVGLAAGKPAEFARFLIVPVLLLAVAAAVLLAALARRRVLLALALTLVCLASLGTLDYVRAFAADARGTGESRAAAGRFLAERMQDGESLAVLQEPSPYAVPPVDFARRRVVLLPEREPAKPAERISLPEWLVFTADELQTYTGAWWQAHYELVRVFPGERRATPITWASKPAFVFHKRATSPT